MAIIKNGVCSLCGGRYEGLGHNPEPLKPLEQRCCSRCNDEKVLPARLTMLPERAAEIRTLTSKLGHAERDVWSKLGHPDPLMHAPHIPVGHRQQDPVNVLSVGDASLKTRWNEVDRVVAAIAADRAEAAAKARTELFRKSPALAMASGLMDLQRQSEDEVAKAFAAWLRGPLVLEKPQHSVCHLAVRELDLQPVNLTLRGGKVIEREEADLGGELHSMLIQHDWAKLLGASAVSGGDHPDEPMAFPFRYTCFEFAISGVRVCCFVSQTQDPESTFDNAMSLAFRLPGQGWLADRVSLTLDWSGWRVLSAPKHLGPHPVEKDLARLFDFLFEQIRAVVAMLDAEVAETEATRAPYNRNEPPRKDRPPLPPISHHVVSLAKRHRLTPAPGPALGEPHRRPPRLHFRRGHWRHYQSHKTWINWQLVGDPDLGFVDKDYRL